MKCKSSRAGEWCGYCYAGIRGRETFKGHAAYRRGLQLPEEDDLMVMIRRSTAGHKGVPAATIDGEGLEAVAPALMEFLTLCVWEDGKVRQTGTLMLLAEGGRWKAWLHDRDQRRSGWVTAATLRDLIDAVERGVHQESVDWRVDRKGV